MRQKRSVFPERRIFQELDLDTSLSEAAVRIIANVWEDPEIVGTGTVIAGSIVLTGRHVIEDLIVRYGHDVSMMKSSISLLQLLNGGRDFFLWYAWRVYLHPWADIAILHVSTGAGMSREGLKPRWPQLRIAPFAPALFEKVMAFGYRKGGIELKLDAQLAAHLKSRDKPTLSSGVVQEIHEYQRDSRTMPFPCYRVNARFDGGMSGGPVFNEYGDLCGLVCSGFETDDEPISYVCSLWPLFTMRTDIDRVNVHPKGATYPTLDWVAGGQVAVWDPARLIRWLGDPALKILIANWPSRMIGQ